MDDKIIERQFLGKILMDRNILSQSQLTHALEVQKEREEYFGEERGDFREAVALLRNLP